MTADDRQLVQRLFALSTMIASDAHESAARGQSLKLQFDDYIQFANDVRQNAAALAIIAEAVIIALRQGRVAQVRTVKRRRLSR